jgi:predicted AlkP superfamily pyrophosphatase or phosphodiesterase
VANTFWWYAMNTGADYTVTPRPLYCADGRKLPDCYSAPLDLRDRFNRDFGQFPLFKFWGPATSIESSDWIGKSAMAIEAQFRPTLQLVYLPHLDYCLQKVGPQGNLGKDLAEIDALCGQLLDYFQERNCRVVVLSEYGITPVSHPIHPNRILRDAGLLSLKIDLGREYLDPGTSRAFAVADHQVCHIYVRDTRDIPAIKSLFSRTPGIEQVLDHEGKKACGLDHERSGELVLVASADSWFTYYWWLDDQRAPDYARTVNIHAKPGYDPCELFLDPAIPFPKLKIATLLAKKMLGFRYLMDVIPLDATLVQAHGRITDAPEDGLYAEQCQEPARQDHQGHRCLRSSSATCLLRLAHENNQGLSGSLQGQQSSNHMDQCAGGLLAGYRSVHAGQFSAAGPGALMFLYGRDEP